MIQWRRSNCIFSKWIVSNRLKYIEIKAHIYILQENMCFFTFKYTQWFSKQDTKPENT